MKKVMCSGTFDGLHPGHLNFFKQANKQGDYLVVVVARDINVKKIKERLPRNNEQLRLRKVKQVDIIDEAILGQTGNIYNIIKTIKPDVICLGYDQKVDIEKLKINFKGEIIRLKPYKEDIYKSSKIQFKYYK